MNKVRFWIAFVIMVLVALCLAGLTLTEASSHSMYVDYEPVTETVPIRLRESIAISNPLTVTVYLPLTCRDFHPPIVLRVGGSGEYTTIQDAINSATTPHEYIIQVAQGTYTENITLTASMKVYLQGGWNASFTSFCDDSTLTIIDGGERDSVLNVQADSGISITLRIEGFTIQNGSAEQGAGINAVASGAGSHLSLTMRNNTITGNATNTQVDFDGGGIWAEAAGSGPTTGVILASNVITGNMSQTGGGMAAQSLDGGHLIATLADNVISWNTATVFAAGIWLNSGRTGSTTAVTLTRNVISNNRGPQLDGGGIAAYASDANANTTLVIKNNLITNNSAEYGGGVFGYAWGGDSLLDITLKNNIIAGNEAGYGGAVFSCSGRTCPVTLPEGSVFWTLINNTIAGNTATNGSDVIHLHSGSPFGDGGFITLSMVNDIVWGTSDSSGADEVTVVVDDGRAGTAEAHVSYSDIGSIVAHGVATYTLDHVLIGADPLFVDPANQDYLLQDGSPCIDAGDPNPAYNDGQCPPGRGTERGDMGAYGGPNNDNWP